MSNEKKAEVKEEKKDPVLPVEIPLSILRWILYSVVMFVLLLPIQMTILQSISIALLLGHFSGQLNALKGKQ